MDAERAWNALFAVVIVALVGALVVEAGLVTLPGDDRHDRARVTVLDGDGTRLAVVEARVADTPAERRTGLSDTDSLANGSGMLFVLDSGGPHTFWMKGMDFAIDIIYVDANGTVTSVHHARAPGPGEDGRDLRYRGRGKYVLEVPRGYANATGIEEGDRIEIEFLD